MSLEGCGNILMSQIVVIHGISGVIADLYRYNACNILKSYIWKVFTL